jgi:opacity protein-like surface antigen
MRSLSLRSLSNASSNPRGSKSLAIMLSAAASLPALLMGLSGASAADLSYKDERPAIMSYGGGSWAGFYFGAHAGAAVDTDRDRESFFANSGQGGTGGAGGGATGGAGGLGGAAANVEIDADNHGDALVGLHIGYNWQNANLVYGVEADIDANNSLDDLLGSVRARFGFATDRTLFYVTGGLAYISIDGAEAAFAAGAGGAGGDGGDFGGGSGGGGGGGGLGAAGRLQQDSESDVGFVAGLGVEHKITNQVGIGLEGLYYSFGEDKIGLTNDGDFFSVRARLTMHLDRDNGSIKDSYPALANWGGFYLGGHLGAQLSDDDVIESTAASAGNGGGGGGNGGPTGGGGGGGGGSGGVAIANLGVDTALIGGAHLGYNWQSGSWVYGLEGDASFSDTDQYSYLASARARIGYATGSYLFYGTAGVAFAGLDRIAGIEAFNGGDGGDGGNGPAGAPGVGGIGGDAGAAPRGVRDEDDVVGFVVGAGVDAKLTDRLTLGFEGLYYGFDVDDKTGGNQSFDSDADVFVLRSRISYSLTPHVEALK